MENELEKKETVSESSEVKTENKEGKKWECKLGKYCKENKAMLIAAIVLILLVAGSFVYVKYFKKTVLKPEEAKSKVEKYINENLMQPGSTVKMKDVTVDGDLYKVTILVGTQEVVGYVTKDGSKFFPQAFELNKTEEQASKTPAVPEKTEAEQKADVPTVDLFVMSYCPYGLQMERGVLPAIEALGNKIKFNLKFVSYTLHGQKEVDENLNQYCIEKTQPTKLDNYLKCFWKDSKGTSAACMKTAGINAAQITSCVADANKQFAPTEKDFGIDKDENAQFGVQGSPTLVVNGTKVSSGRDSASVLKAICSGFANQPKECQTKLSATSPAAGFDDQAAAAGSGNASAASCGTK